MTDETLHRARASLLEMRAALAHVLGVQTVDVLIDRAAVEVGVAHPGLEGIRLDGDGLNLSGLDGTFSDAPAQEIEAAFKALTAVLLLILARLVGHQIAESIAARVPSAAPAARASGSRGDSAT